MEFANGPREGMERGERWGSCKSTRPRSSSLALVEVEKGENSQRVFGLTLEGVLNLSSCSLAGPSEKGQGGKWW